MSMDRVTKFAHVDDGLRDRDSYEAVRLDLNPATGGFSLTIMDDDGIGCSYVMLSGADAAHLAECLIKMAVEVRKSGVAA